MFFKTVDNTQTADLYDQVAALTKELLYAECPQHRAQHHILYTANERLLSYGEARDALRMQSSPATHNGRLMQSLYEQASTRYNQLYLLIRAYMHMSDDSRRAHFNHHFQLSSTLIEQLSTQLVLYKQSRELLAMDDTFWQALKDDFIPLLTQLE